MIDDLDLKLIRSLQTNGRLSYIDLSKELDVVEGTIRRRMKQLIDGGIIRLAAIPNMQEMGYGFITIVGLRVQLSEKRQVARLLASYKQICFMASVTGQYDLMAIVIARNASEYSQFLDEVNTLPGILGLETYVSIEIIKGKWLMADV